MSMLLKSKPQKRLFLSVKELVTAEKIVLFLPIKELVTAEKKKSSLREKGKKMPEVIAKFLLQRPSLFV
jgi:hypothetical protein